jgi:hypothetical protein
MNTELLLKVKEEILAEPRKLQMDAWLWPADDFSDVKSPEEMPPCGTIGCIAGWTVAIARAEAEGIAPLELAEQHRALTLDVSIRTAAKDLLGLKRERLFFHDDEASECWPGEFVERLEKEAPGTPGYARVVADVIDDLIANPAAWGEEA